MNWTELDEFERDGYRVIVSIAGDDTIPRDQLDDKFFDVDEICSLIATGSYDWVIVRLELLKGTTIVASELVGGCLYKNIRDCLSDGLVDSLFGAAKEYVK